MTREDGSMQTFEELAAMSPARREALIDELPFAALVELGQTLSPECLLGQACRRMVTLATQRDAVEAQRRANDERLLGVERILRNATVDMEAGTIAALRVEVDMRSAESKRLWDEREVLYNATTESEKYIRTAYGFYAGLLAKIAAGDQQLLSGNINPELKPTQIKEERDGMLAECRRLAGSVPPETEVLTRRMAGIRERQRLVLLGPDE